MFPQQVTKHPNRFGSVRSSDIFLTVGRSRAQLHYAQEVPTDVMVLPVPVSQKKIQQEQVCKKWEKQKNRDTNAFKDKSFKKILDNSCKKRMAGSKRKKILPKFLLECFGAIHRGLKRYTKRNVVFVIHDALHEAEAQSDGLVCGFSQERP